MWQPSGYSISLAIAVMFNMKRIFTARTWFSFTGEIIIAVLHAWTMVIKVNSQVKPCRRAGEKRELHLMVSDQLWFYPNSSCMFHIVPYPPQSRSNHHLYMIISAHAFSFASLHPPT